MVCYLYIVYTYKIINTLEKTERRQTPWKYVLTNFSIFVAYKDVHRLRINNTYRKELNE